MGPAREVATDIVRTLSRSGHTAYFAGGCVRDELLGLHPTDYDVATDATPDRVDALFRHTNKVGAAFGVVLVRISGVTVEVATFREEGVYSDNRRPDEVRYADAEHDARRRDFTINALFLDPLAEGEQAPVGLRGGEEARPVRGRVIDMVDGVKDLREGVIRAVGEPSVRLAEDHLRALRGVRFAARLGFRIDERTAQAIVLHAAELRGVSRERVGDEMRRMLATATRTAAVRLVEDLGLDGPALDEAVIGHAVRDRPAIESLPADASFGSALAAWAVDRLDARTGGRADADEIECDATERARGWRKSLCLSNAEHEEFVGVLRLLAALSRDWPRMGVAARKRMAASPWRAGAMCILRGRRAELAGRLESEIGDLESTAGGLAPPPLVTGDDLLTIGATSGPLIGRVLERVYDAQLEGVVRSRDDALRLARRWLDEG